MFSKALFKQTAKANWIKWVAVTLATCIMLAIVIIVLGNLGINDIRDSLKDVFTQADQEAILKENAVDMYDLYLTTADVNGQMNTFSGFIGSIITDYDNALSQYETDNGVAPDDAAKNQIATQQVEAFLNQWGSIIEGMMPELDLDELKVNLINVLLNHSANPTLTNKELLLEEMYYPEVYKNAYALAIEEGKTEADAVSQANEAVSQAKNMVTNLDTVGTQTDYSEFATTYVNNEMYETVRKMQIDEGATEDEAHIYATSVKVISNTALSTYQLWLNEGATQENAKKEATKSISDQIPEKVSEALEELGNMDMYGLIIGSIFYRIAGLLLPMVFVIMVANGLLAGQVDSGSMAYVLSTPTKRRTVTVTQMAYMLWALLSMFAIVTAVSVVSVWIVGGNNFAINFAEILLFNLGAFLTMFAFAGFCFMCSAIFNRSKYSMSIGGGLTIFMLVCTILGLFGSDVVPSAMRIEAMNFFNYLSIITFFDTTSILAGSLSYLWKFAILAGIGIVTFIVGVFTFDKKDLPL